MDKFQKNFEILKSNFFTKKREFFFIIPKILFSILRSQKKVNKQPPKHKSAACVCQQGEVKCGRCPPSIHPLPLSFSLILPSQSPPLTAVSRLLPPTRKASAPFAKMEIDTFSTTTISTLAIFLYAMLRILNKEVRILIAKEKVVSWLGQVRQRHRRIWR